jgi:exopolysaccharide biosynthesis polyprenyl glycosylphosphotransferase
MQSDLESSMPMPSYKEQEALRLKSESYVQLTELLSRQQGLRGTRRPSSTLWHLILTAGDLALLAILCGVLFFFHHVPLVASNIVGVQEIQLIWVCLGLVSWSIAVNLAQSQSLNYASNRFKGPCCTLFALVAMCFLWLLLSDLLLGLNIITSIKLEVFFLLIAIPPFMIWRFLFAEFKHLPRFRLWAVIVGVNSAGKIVAKELQNSRSSSINILGYISDNSEEYTQQDGLSILGDRETLHYLAYHNMIDMIIVALEYGTSPALFKEATDAAQLGISVLPMTVVYENSTGKIPVEHVGDQWYAALQTERILSPLYLCWKKGLDLACGTLGMLLLCLVFPVIALCIYLDSPGPIFYSQERVGFRGKALRIYKFRTMRPDAESKGQAIWAAKADARITRIGRFLRSTHIDELPQLWNILRGDMSMIGPRPERAAFIKDLEKTVPFYGHRLAVKPGLTGWAQVKYRYGSSSNDALIKLQYDLYYIKRQSFMLDLFIILKTVVEVLYLRGV